MTYRHWKDSGRGRRVTDPQKEQLTSWIPIWYRRIMRQPPQTPCPPVSCPLSVGTGGGGHPGRSDCTKSPVKAARLATQDHTRRSRGCQRVNRTARRLRATLPSTAPPPQADARGTVLPLPSRRTLPRSCLLREHPKGTQERGVTHRRGSPSTLPPLPTYLFGE